MTGQLTKKEPGIRWGRWAAVALAIGTLAPAAGCQFGTLTGDTYSGGNVGRSLYIAGYATTAATNIDVWVLDDVTADPYVGGPHWQNIGSTVSSVTPYTDAAGTDWYAYSLYVTPVANAGQSYRWPDGGIVRLKTTAPGINLLTFDQEFFDCVAPLLGDFTNAGSTCMSPTAPVNGVVDIDPLPAATDDYLSFRETAAAETNQYYASVLAAPGQPRFTFAGWKAQNTFPNVDEVVAYYFNDGDLGFGRQMHCRATAYNNGKACYVTNFNDVSVAATLDDTINSNDPVATVAMEYWPNAANDKVRFFVYDAAGNRLNSLALDSEGNKNVPGLCLSCHGGTYSTATNHVTNAKFLPFDIYSFFYSGVAGFTRTDQEEEFRQLNALVNSTNPTVAIADLINGWYGGNVNVPLTTVNDNYIPVGWSGNDKERVLYKKVVEDYCRSCHIALEDYHDWLSYAELSVYDIEGYVCDDKTMPHAERTREHFWESPARAHLLNVLKLPTTCN